MFCRYLLPVLCLMAITAYAEESFRPAHLGYEDEDRRLLKILKFPEIKGDVSVTLLCFTQLEASGKMENTACIAKDQFDGPFAAVMNLAGKKARMAPAEIDGKNVKVFVQFRAEFKQKGEDRTVKIVLNPGEPENVGVYGEEHVAAQRVIGSKEPWMAICPQRAQYAVWAKAFVGEDGNAENPSVEHSGGVMPTATCQNAIMETVLASRYIPAFVDGLPVPSTFVELFSN